MAELSSGARLAQFPIFEGFSGEELALVSKLVEEREYQDQERIFLQDAAPDALYLVEDGLAREERLEASGEVVPTREAEPGDMVGRWAMYNRQPYPTTAHAHGSAKLLVIREDRFESLLDLFPVLRDRLSRVQVVNRLLAIPLFAGLTEEEMFYVADLVDQREYSAGQTIFQQGEQPEEFFVIDRGQVRETATGSLGGTQTWPKYLTAGNFFGRYSLLHGTARRATAEATTDVKLISMSAYDFECLRNRKEGFRDALTRFDMLHYLRQTELFSKLDEEELKELAGYVGLAHYRQGDILFYQGDTDPTAYLLYAGEALALFRDEHGRERPRDYLTPGRTVGLPFLFFRGICDYTLRSVGDSKWLYLTRDDLDAYLTRRPEARSNLIPPEATAALQHEQRFDWLESEEEMVFLDRRHWFYLASRLTLATFLLAVAIILILASGSQTASQLLLRVVGVILLIPSAFAVVWIVLDWLNDYYVVTDSRAVHQEKVILIRQTRDEAPLNKIQNVNIDRHFIGNLLGFGTLLINTAAAREARRVIFNYLPNPQLVQSIILAQMERARVEAQPETRRSIRQSLGESVGPVLHPLVPRPVIPSELLPKPAAPQPPIWTRVYRATLGPLFWIEEHTNGQVTWRKHWIRLLARIWLPLLTLVLLLVAFSLLVSVIPGEPFLLDMFLLVLVVPALGWLWWEWTNWGNDLYIVTEDRIIDTEKLPLGFRYQRTEATFDRIQNVSFEIPHPIATILNYGTVMIFTAGAEGRLDFSYVRDPSGVQTEIFRRINAFEQAQLEEQREEQNAELPQWFSVYDETYHP